MRERLSLVYGTLWRRAGTLDYEIRRTAAAFLFLAALSFGVCAACPSLGQRLADYLTELIGDMGVVTGEGRLSAPALFANNLRACMVTMLYGLLPFLYLPALALGMNALALGGLGAWYLHQGGSLAAWLAGLLPHGVFELPALVLSMAMGLCVCGHVSRRVRGDKSALSLWECLALTSRMLFLAAAPLLAAAALAEAYVTPAVAAFFS